MVSEDRDLLLEKASMNNVLDVLEREGELMVSYGEKGTDGRYARKFFAMYTLTDRRERFSMRQDITAEYLEQRRQKKRLSDALLHARD